MCPRAGASISWSESLKADLHPHTTQGSTLDEQITETSASGPPHRLYSTPRTALPVKLNKTLPERSNCLFWLQIFLFCAWQIQLKRAGILLTSNSLLSSCETCALTHFLITMLMWTLASGEPLVKLVDARTGSSLMALITLSNSNSFQKEGEKKSFRSA